MCCLVTFSRPNTPMCVTSRRRENSVKMTNPSIAVNALLPEQLVEPFPETVWQRNDLLIACDEQQQVANSIIDSSAPSASSQMFFNRDSPLRRKLLVEVRGEFTNDLPTADYYAHSVRSTRLLRFPV